MPAATPDFFVSHSSANASTAKSVETALQTAGFGVWLDSSDIRVGALLRKELHTAIEKSRAVVLLWSKPAAQSRWVAAEILTAFHLNRFIVPCVLDEAPAPHFLGKSVRLDLRKTDAETLQRLVRSAQQAPDQANPTPPRMSSASAELNKTIQAIAAAQQEITGPLMKRDVARAAQVQQTLDPVMEQAQDLWPLELMILNLAGYHRKNAYMIKHWDAIQAGRPPEDPVLLEAERYFFEALFVDPLEMSALNGLGSILVLEQELDAADFFVSRAISLAQRKGIDYRAAKVDKQTIDRLRLPSNHRSLTEPRP